MSKFNQTSTKSSVTSLSKLDNLFGELKNLADQMQNGNLLVMLKSYEQRFSSAMSSYENKIKHVIYVIKRIQQELDDIKALNSKPNKCSMKYVKSHATTSIHSDKIPLNNSDQNSKNDSRSNQSHARQVLSDINAFNSKPKTYSMLKSEINHGSTPNKTNSDKVPLRMSVQNSMATHSRTDSLTSSRSNQVNLTTSKSIDESKSKKFSLHCKQEANDKSVRNGANSSNTSSSIVKKDRQNPTARNKSASIAITSSAPVNIVINFDMRN